METDLTIDNVLAAVEALATKEHQTVEAVLSELARKARSSDDLGFVIDEDGFPVLLVRDRTPITLPFVNELRDELP